MPKGLQNEPRRVQNGSLEASGQPPRARRDVGGILGSILGPCGDPFWGPLRERFFVPLSGTPLFGDQLTSNRPGKPFPHEMICELHILCQNLAHPMGESLGEVIINV